METSNTVSTLNVMLQLQSALSGDISPLEIATVFTIFMGPAEVVVQRFADDQETRSLDERQLGILMAGIFALAKALGMEDKVNSAFHQVPAVEVGLSLKGREIN